MIAPNTRKQIRKRLAQQHAKTLAHVQRSFQKTLYAVLWQMIRKNTDDALEDGLPDDADAVLTVPIEDMESIPANFALKLTQNPADKTVSIVATLAKPKSNILLPDGSQAG